MTTKHTPGPWRIGKSYGAVVADVPVNSGFGVVAAYGGHLIAESIAVCNRPLIAAAPELMEALQQMLDTFVDDPLSHQYTSGRAVDAAREAIAKARGSQ